MEFGSSDVQNTMKTSDMVYSDDELVMISALQHYLFCKRQCALIHLEGAWNENRLTAEGRVLHDKVDRHGSETRRALHQATSLRLVSHQLGITGVADMVEFHQVDSENDASGRRIATKLKGLREYWSPFPVEYKHGRPKSHRADEVQLCAQAICLEEMLGVVIPSGALFYGEPRRRYEIVFDETLRDLTRRVADSVHELLSSGQTPPPVYGKPCRACSLYDMCQPRMKNSEPSAREWLAHEMEDAIQ